MPTDASEKRMRIAFFHNWSWLGSSIGHSLLSQGQDQLRLYGGPLPASEQDPELIAHARQTGAPSSVPGDLSSPAFLEELAAFAPELVLVGTFASKLPPSVLAVPVLGAWNVHSSLLPSYRGALPEFWVIRNGEPRSGVTVHEMDDRFDEGAILAQQSFPLSAEENLLSISAKLADLGPKLVRGLLDRLRAGERPPSTPQDHRLASRAPAVKPEHLRVRWEESAVSIERLCRAADPVFEVDTTLRGARLVLRTVRPVPDLQPLAPGELLFEPALHLLFAGTGEGSLMIEAVELEAERLSGPRLVERLGLRPGERLQ